MVVLPSRETRAHLRVMVPSRNRLSPGRCPFSEASWVHLLAFRHPLQECRHFPTPHVPCARRRFRDPLAAPTALSRHRCPHRLTQTPLFSPRIEPPQPSRLSRPASASTPSGAAYALHFPHPLSFLSLDTTTQITKKESSTAAKFDMEKINEMIKN